MRDPYRGYEIDYSREHSGYWVFKDNKLVHRAYDYDSAIDWIDQKAETSR